MSDDLSPKILVKKADGTFVHMSLSELQKKHTDGPAQPAAPKAIAAPAPSAPVLPSPKKDDLKSLLEEPVPVFKEAAPLTSALKEKQVDEIVKSLSFKTPIQNDSRLRSIIMSFLKDVRGQAEFLEILMRAEIAGGVGLSESQANEIFTKAREKKQGKKEPAPVALPKPVSAAKFSPKENDRLEKEVPMVRNNFTFPKPAAPVVKPEIKSEVKTVIKSIAKPEPPKPAPVLEKTFPSEAPVFKIDTGHPKTTMNDVKAPPLSLGPIDEIRFFSLVDFRRLSTNPGDAAKRLKQKFLNLREESIMLYFDALDAWHDAPLYRDYLAMISEALEKRLPIGKINLDQKRIQQAEITAILQMEKELSL